MKKAIPANISKILVYFCIALLFSVAASAVFLNRARLYSADGQQMNAEHIVSDYVKRMGKNAKCRVSIKPEFPKRFPSRFEELWHKNQMVWDYSWSCSAGGDDIEGILSVFADGNTAWSGTSSKTGDIPTEEY